MATELIFDPRFVACECCGVWFHAGGGAIYTGERVNSEGDMVSTYMCERCGTGQCDCEEIEEQQEAERMWEGSHAPGSRAPWLGSEERE